MAVRATPTHWIKRIRSMASVETKSYFEEVLQEELEGDKGRVTKELVKTDWNQFSQVMSKALDLQQKSSKKREENFSLHLVLQRILDRQPWEEGARQQEGARQ